MSPESTAPSGQALPAGTRLEEFEVESVLGTGGFGITYLARDRSLGRKVVIKENLPSAFAFRDTASGTVRSRSDLTEDEDNFRWSLQNFLREADTLASLKHPGIVQVLRKFETNGTAYFVMPYMEGLPLDELMKNRRKRGEETSDDELRGLLEHVLDALGYLHARGIYHRDIKPGNILVTKEGVPILIDFGSARQRLSERSMTVVESAGYTPFEQLESRGNVGPWSDLYALGATVSKAITGEPPPKAMDRVRTDPYEPLSRRPNLRERYSGVLLDSIDRALEVEESVRWQDAGQWQRGLMVVEEPIPPAPPVAPEAPARTMTSPGPGVAGSPPVQLPVEGKKKPSKGFLVAVGAAAAALLLIVGVGVALTGNNGAEEERVRLAEEEKLAAQKKATAAEAALELVTSREEPAQKVTVRPGSRAGEETRLEIEPGVELRMCWIAAGSFQMGSPANEAGRFSDERQHSVTLTKGFWLGRTEVTQGQWEAVMGDNPSDMKGKDLPVEQVSWEEAREFCAKLNKVVELPEGWSFTLPSEAQWEYGCRAGTTGVFAGNLDELGWHEENSGKKTHAVGTKEANGWGLHDMHGNVWEWCADWYGEYPTVEAADPRGPSGGSLRVLRGGCWYGPARDCRSAYRYGSSPGFRHHFLGFRLVLQFRDEPEAGGAK